MKNKLRVLLTGCGGPAAVAFMRSLSNEDLDFFAADLDPNAAGLYLVPADRRFLLPPGASPHFVETLLKMCATHKIDILVPTVDCELLPIAEASERFEAIGTMLMLTSAASLRLSLDKLATLKACDGVIPVPRFAVFDQSFNADEWNFPLIVKPRSASGSRGVIKVNSPEELAKLNRSSALLVQEYLPGEEYSVDVWSTGNGDPKIAVPRTRSKVDSGITVTGYTLHDPYLEAIAKLAAQTLGTSFVANVQFRRDANGEPRLLEINARFPGTMTLTVASGVHMPLLSLRETIGMAQEYPANFRDTAVVRFWEDHFFAPDELFNLKGCSAVASKSLDQETAAA